MLKAEIWLTFAKRREGPYDIYYYCTHCEDSEAIRHGPLAAIESPGVRETIRRLHWLFQYPDSEVGNLRILDCA